MAEKKVYPDRFVGYKFVGRGRQIVIGLASNGGRWHFVSMLLINPTIFHPRHTSEVIGRWLVAVLTFQWQSNIAPT